MTFRFKKTVIGLLSFVLVTSSAFISFADTDTASVNETAIPDEGYVKCAQMNEYVMYADFKSGEFTVENETTGSRWYSTPPGAEQDEYAQGINKTNLYSHILLQYIDENNSENITNSYAACFKRNGIEVEKIEHGIKIIYNFKELGIKIPVEVRLCENGFNAKLCLEEIIESEKNLVYNISLFPFLSTASADDSGWMLLPDGCGAVSELNNGKYTATPYHQQVFGADAIEEITVCPPYSEQVYIPVLGLKKNNSALLTYLQSGGGYAYANAYNARMINGYNTVYFDFQLRNSYTFSLSAGDENIEYDRSALSDDTIILNYIMLENGDACFSGMVSAVQNKIFADTVSESKGNDLFLKVISSIKTDKSFLGIPYSSQTALTTYDDLSGMLDDIKSVADVKSTVLLQNFHKDEVSGKVTKRIKPLGILGNKADMNKLFGRKNTSFYVSCTFDRFTSSGNGVNRFFDAARNLSKASTRLFSYLRSTFAINHDRQTGYLVIPDQMIGLYKKYYKSLKDDSFSKIDINTIGNTLYSWYSNKTVNSREKSRDIIVSLLEKMQSDGITITAPMANSYVLPYMTYVYDVATTSSGFMMCDYDVPFYQAVLDGYVGYAALPVNQSSSQNDAFLRVLESNSDLSYTVIYDDTVSLKGTEAEDIFACRYNQQRENILNTVNEFYEFRNNIQGSSIEKYEKLYEGIVRVGFSNGAVLTTNHTADNVTVDSVEIPAGGYNLRRGQ